MKLSAGAERYLTWLRGQPTVTAEAIAEAVARAEALAAERRGQFVTSKDLATAWRTIGRRRVVGRKR